jgi:hypothetical protein
MNVGAYILARALLLDIIFYFHLADHGHVTFSQIYNNQIFNLEKGVSDYIFFF